MHDTKNRVSLTVAGVFAFAALLMIQPETASAQAYPQRPIRLVVPFAAGGGTDIAGRIVAQKLTSALGQSVIVDNRGGAGGVIGADIVAKASPDGYTLLMAANGPLAVAPHVAKKMPYDPLKDFGPVSLVAIIPSIVVVHPSLPVRTIKELVALARAQPGKLNFGSPGRGTTNHLAMELLKTSANIQMTHIAYKGTGPAISDLIGGHVDLLSGDMPALLPHVKSGKLRALAVTTSKRSALLPDLPTVSESGIAGFESSGWFAILTPANAPDAIIQRLNAEMLKAIATDDMREKLSALGAEPTSSSPEQLRVHLGEQLAKWGKVVKSAGIKLD
ncbi:MAG: tripartite tricarboxylate transporter substrate binding protein [Betaproteobacteria bacterium]|nr:tripartite tricarboxylate transporter substrate binding protein [Betaproteobacteria bacterium]